MLEKEQQATEEPKSGEPKKGLQQSSSSLASVVLPIRLPLLPCWVRGLKAIDVRHLEEPSSEIWFGLGLIAEQYGVPDAAKRMYGRVEKPKFDFPGSSYQLSLLRLKDTEEVAKNKNDKAGQ